MPDISKENFSKFHYKDEESEAKEKYFKNPSSSKKQKKKEKEEELKYFSSSSASSESNFTDLEEESEDADFIEGLNKISLKENKAKKQEVTRSSRSK